MTTASAPPSATAAGRLAEFCAGLRWAELDPEVQARTREVLLDLIGVALAGSRQPSSPPAARVALDLGGQGAATIIGTRQTTSAVWAALANGTAAHAVELDDVTTESSLHPGVAVIPAALAVAEDIQAPPARMLEAIVAGYEVTMRVGNALIPASAYARGFHPTGVAGIFGAATAASHLLQLSVDQRCLALGIAGTMASGSLEYLADGAWTKRLNPGWAGHAGITAARLAQAGFNGPRSAFEGRLGVLHAYSDAALPGRLLDDLGEPPQVMRVSIKPYACCRYNHGLIDCMLALRSSFALNDVERIRLGVLSGGALLVADPIEQKRAPVGVVDAQFSAPYAAAVAFARGRARLADYTEASIADPIIRSLMRRAECYRDPALDAGYPAVWPAAVEVETTDGRVLTERTDYFLGEPENPVAREGLVAKFVDLTGERLGGDCALALADRILGLETQPDLARVMDELRG